MHSNKFLGSKRGSFLLSITAIEIVMGMIGLFGLDVILGLLCLVEEV